MSSERESRRERRIKRREQKLNRYVLLHTAAATSKVCFEAVRRRFRVFQTSKQLTAVVGQLESESAEAKQQ